MNPIARLAVAFPQPPVDPSTLALYMEKLSGEKLEHVRAACEHAVDTAQHFPRLADLKAHIRAAKIRERSENERRARLSEGEAWSRAAEDGGGSEIAHMFRSPSSCRTLAGESWTQDELLGANGGRSLKNNIHYRALEGMRAKLSDALDARVARNPWISP